MALYNAISPSVVTHVWNSFFCEPGQGNSACANTTIHNMMYQAMLDTSPLPSTANLANTQALNGTYWNGYVGEDDGQGPSGSETTLQQSSYTYEDPRAYSQTKTFVAPSGTLFYPYAVKLTCKNGGGTNQAAAIGLDAADLSNTAYRISNRLIISDFFAWRWAVYDTKTSQVFARRRITVTNDLSINGAPDFIPTGGATHHTNDGKYPVESGGGMPNCP